MKQFYEEWQSYITIEFSEIEIDSLLTSQFQLRKSKFVRY